MSSASMLQRNEVRSGTYILKWNVMENYAKLLGIIISWLCNE